MWHPLGHQARWRILYGMLQGVQVGDVVTYDDMAAELGLDPVLERMKVQMAMRRAAEQFERVDKRCLDVIPNHGYRVVTAAEHVGLASRHQRKAGKSLERGHSKAVNVDLSNVDAQTRQALETLARGFALQMDVNTRVEARQERMQKALDSVATQQERAEDDIAELRERLDRLAELIRE